MIRTSRTELLHIFWAWLAISLAFTNLHTGFVFNSEFFVVLVISAITVGLGFFIHELAHKVVAQRYGCFAEFRADYPMLLLAILMSFFGFIFAAPGAVMIMGHVTVRRNGIISAAGPFANFLLAGLFFILLSFAPTGSIIRIIALSGLSINAFLGLFNLIPFGFFDGQKILAWNKIAYAILVISGIGLLVLSYIVAPRA